jgi:YVTN family beta-propeller protein
VVLADGRTLCVANRRSGTVSVVGLGDGAVRDEVAVGDSLADLTALPDRRHLLGVDETAAQLVALDCDSGIPTVRKRLPVAASPVSVAVVADGTRATVACLWSRRVEVVDVTPLSSPGGAVRALHSVPLPFAPRLQLALPGGPRVVVADAFGGHLALLDAAAGRLIAVHELSGHNLRGLAVSADGRDLLVAHQMLDPHAPATEENVRRGVLMANVVRHVPLTDLGSPGLLTRLGGVGAGAGDPAGIIAGNGRTAVALSGVNEVALLDPAGRTTHRVPVGRRPTAVVPAPDGRLVVLNTFDDSVSVLDPNTAAVVRTVPLGPAAKLGFRERGELLFHDARVSPDGSMSCQSCHPDGHTNGLNADTLSDGSYGTPKRTLTLLGTGMNDPWGWTGGTRYLHDQVEVSLRSTMHDPAVTAERIGDLTTFLHNLPPPPPLQPAAGDATDRAQVERGRRVFASSGCVNCHIPPLTYSTHGTFDVGLTDERGQRKFNPPSLRGVGQGYRFLHDGRAAKLEEVFTEVKHPYGGDLEPGDLADLLRFLRSL